MPKSCSECPLPTILNNLNANLPEDEQLQVNSADCDTQIDNCPSFGNNGALCNTVNDVAGMAMSACGHNCSNAAQCMVPARNQERNPRTLREANISVDDLAALL